MTPQRPPRPKSATVERDAAAFLIALALGSLGILMMLSGCHADVSSAFGWIGSAASRASAPMAPAEDLPPSESIRTSEPIRSALVGDDASSSMARYERSMIEEPGSISTRILHARLLTLAGQWDDAREELALVLDGSPQNEDALYSLSEIDDLQGRTEERISLLRQIVRVNPMHADALADLGDLALTRGDGSQARAFFQRALQADPRNVVALIGSGALLARQGAYRESLASYDRAASVEPQEPLTYIDRAAAREVLGDREGAVQDLSRAIDLDPRSSSAYLQRGRLYVTLRRPSDALADFTLAVRMAPDQAQGYALRAALLDDVARSDSALEDWQTVIQLCPDFEPAFLPLGIDAWSEQDWPAARDAFLHLYQANPREPALLLVCALCDLRDGEVEEARQLLSLALSKVPRPSWYHDAALFLQGASGEARLLARIDGERDPALRGRMLFYVAVDYLITGRERAGSIYLSRIGGGSDGQDLETRLAGIERSRTR